MAGLTAILGRLLRLVSREISSFNAISGNNLLLIVFLLGQGGGAAVLFPVMLLGLLVLIPMSAHPLRKIPPERLNLWPLTRRQRLVLQVSGIWLSPATWVVAVLVAIPRYRTLGLLLIGFLMPAQIIGYLVSRLSDRMPALNPLYDLPPFPGRFGELVRKDLRELLRFLDPWVALVLCAGTAVYKFTAAKAAPEASTVMSVVGVTIMGTSAQCLFGLEGAGGFTRYRLMPLRGWQVLGAKGAAWLAIIGVLVLPLDPVAGLSAGLMTLGIGHIRSVNFPYPQTRWRFTGGELIPFGLIQTILSVSAGIGAGRMSAWWGLPCLGFYVGSLWYYGNRWEAAR